jgi:hypothetical protein
MRADDKTADGQLTAETMNQLFSKLGPIPEVPVFLKEKTATEKPIPSVVVEASTGVDAPAKGIAKISRRGKTRHKTNPFIPEINQSTKVRRVVDKKGEKLWVMSSETGQVHTQAGFWYAQEVDKTQFVKLYINGVRQFKELTSSGTKVFEVLYSVIRANIGRDRIYINYQHVDQELNPMSEATFYRGMKELVEKDFIAECTDTCFYFVNPDYIWNGDRLAFVKEYRIKQNKIGQKDVKTLDLFDEK